MKTGDRIRILRKEHGLTQKELANILSVERATVTGYETGRITPAKDKIKVLASHFDVSTDYILCETDLRNATNPESEDVAKQLLTILKEIESSDNHLLYNGDKMDSSTKTLLVTSLKNSIELIDAMSKNKNE